MWETTDYTVHFGPVTMTEERWSDFLDGGELRFHARCDCGFEVIEYGEDAELLVEMAAIGHAVSEGVSA